MNPNPLRERELYLTRRQLFGKTALGLGTAAMAMSMSTTMTAFCGCGLHDWRDKI